MMNYEMEKKNCKDLTGEDGGADPTQDKFIVFV